MLHIDCSYAEGGGQIVRTALALATVTQRPFLAEKIRLGRPEPGLKAQHLACIEALERFSGAQATGAHLGATGFRFHPGKVVPQTLSIDIGTAGSITLLLQSLLLPCCLASGKVRLRIKGGTDCKWAMPIDYFTNVVLPHYALLAEFKVNEMRRGYYPKGQGFFDITVIPKKLDTYPTLELTEPGEVSKIRGVSSASCELREAEVAKRQAQGARKRLGTTYQVKIVEEYQETASVGTVITLWAEAEPVTMATDALGERNRRAEAVGAEAAGKLLDTIRSGAVVDSHLADNLVPLLCYLGGSMRVERITNHTLSNIYACERFLDKKIIIRENTLSA